MSGLSGGQQFIRQVNNAIYKILSKLGAEDGEFWCECADVQYYQRVLLTLREYAALALAATAATKTPLLYRNCTNLNKRYLHGIGKAHARDHTAGKPVTNFVRSDRLYRIAMSYNRGLDRDKDGIACEKA